MIRTTLRVPQATVERVRNYVEEKNKEGGFYSTNTFYVEAINEKLNRSEDYVRN